MTAAKIATTPGVRRGSASPARCDPMFPDTGLQAPRRQAICRCGQPPAHPLWREPDPVADQLLRESGVVLPSPACGWSHPDRASARRCYACCQQPSADMVRVGKVGPLSVQHAMRQVKPLVPRELPCPPAGSCRRILGPPRSGRPFSFDSSRCPGTAAPLAGPAWSCSRHLPRCGFDTGRRTTLPSRAARPS